MSTSSSSSSVTLTSACTQTREQFVNHRDVSDAGQVEQHLLEAEEARRFLLEGLVQGKLNERGNYELRVEPQHTTKEGEEPDPIKDPTAST